MRVDFDPDKFKEMLLYAAARLQDGCAGGARKLNQTLFLAEFTHLRRHHQIISGCEFEKAPYGPVPRELLLMRQDLIGSGEAQLLEEDFFGRPQHRLIPVRVADFAVFADEEVQTIKDVVTRLADMTGGQVSELCDQEPGWRLTDVGETIPYSTAFLDYPQVQTPTSTRLSESVAARYEFATAE